jgi:glycosyltransferase involved in cell wall biosynthesis
LKISIVTVCYNSRDTIAQTLQSVAAQCWPDLEHIIIDGASSDDTLQVIGAHSHAKMRLISEPDNGIYDAMNKGLGLATGDYVAFLNSDDLYARHDAVRLVAERAIATKADCIMGDVQFFDTDPTQPTGRFYSARGFAKWRMKIGIMPPHPALFVRRALLNEAGGFDVSYRIAADFDLAARLILRHKANWEILGQTITLFRSGGLSTEGGMVRPALSREFARSLQHLSVRWPRARILLRYPIKALQLLPYRHKYRPL